MYRKTGYAVIVELSTTASGLRHSGERCPERLSNSQAVSLIQHVLMTLVLRLIMNGGFISTRPIACSEFFRVSWVNRWGSPSEVQHNVTTKVAHVQEQSEFTYGGYLVAAEHLQRHSATAHAGRWPT